MTQGFIPVVERSSVSYDCEPHRSWSDTVGLSSTSTEDGPFFPGSGTVSNTPSFDPGTL